MREGTKFFSRRSVGFLILRLGIGVIFIAHGAGKISGMQTTIEYFHLLGFPTALAYLNAYGEVFGGLALVFGVFTRLASGLLALTMAIVILFLKIHSPLLGGRGFELELSLFVSTAALFLMGGGPLSLGPKFCGCCKGGKCKSGGCSCHFFCGTEHCGAKGMSGSCDGCPACNTAGVCTMHEFENK